MTQMVFKRYEIKYQLNDAQRTRLERVMAEHMVADEYGPSTVRNIYYDTPSHLLARRSSEHPYYKEKLRVRSYADARADTPVFVELKKKCDGIVYKRRCTLPLRDANDLLMGKREPQDQIEREIAFAAHRYEGLAPAMYVAYDRVAYYAADDHEFRMTFDRAVRCRWDEVSLGETPDTTVLMPADMSILEVKCAQGMPLWLVDFLSAEGIRKQSFSKYGTAVVVQMAMEHPVSCVAMPRPVKRPRHLRTLEGGRARRRSVRQRAAVLA